MFLLPNYVKFFKSTVNLVLLVFSNFFNHFQYGFISGFSTTYVTADFVETISRSCDKNLVGLAI